MARFQFTTTPEIAPPGAPEGDYQHIATSSGMFGGAHAQALGLLGGGEETLGQGVEKTSQQGFNLLEFFGQVRTDDQINKLMKQSDSIRYGDPTKPAIGPDGAPLTGPDGRQLPDTGYLGKKGPDALRAQQATLDALDAAIAAGGQNLSPQDKLRYDNETRRLRSFWHNEIGSHAIQQAQTYAEGVNKTGAELWNTHIAKNAYNQDQVDYGTEKLIDYRVQEAQTKFGVGFSKEMHDQVVEDARAEALATQVKMMSVLPTATHPRGDPDAAIKYLNDHKDVAGKQYHALSDELRNRADQQIGDDVAARALRGATDPRIVPVVSPNVPPEAHGLLNLIGAPESNNQYDRRYHGTGDVRFSGFADHPRINEVITSGPDAGKFSSAAGRYQFIASTWDEEKRKLGLKDFSPASQDDAAWDLAQTEYKRRTFGRDLLVDLRNGMPAQQALPMLSGQWSSLPGGRQPAGSGSTRGTAYTIAMNDPATANNPVARQHALQRITQDLTASQIAEDQTEKARKLANDNAAKDYITTINDALHTPEKQDWVALAGKINHDQNLDWRTQEALVSRIKGISGEEQMIAFGPDYMRAREGLFSNPGTPGHIESISDVANWKGITTGGLKDLQDRLSASKKGIDRQSIEKRAVSVLKDVYSRMGIEEDNGYFKMRNPEGAHIFQGILQPEFDKQLSNLVQHAEKTGDMSKVDEFLSPEHVTKFMNSFYNKEQMARDKMNAVYEQTGKEPAGMPPPLAPRGINEAGWKEVMQKRPVGKDDAPLPYAIWRGPIEKLAQNPTADMARAFDQKYPNGKLGWTGAEIIKKLTGKDVNAPDKTIGAKPTDQGRLLVEGLQQEGAGAEVIERLRRH